MKITNLLLIGLLLMLTALSCKDDDSSDSSGIIDCVYDPQPEDRHGLFDIVERQITQDCFENQLSSKEAIEQNLIGTWKLVGHANAWFADGTMPCASVVITEDELVYTFDDTGNPSTTTHSWEIVATEDVLGMASFSLTVAPGNLFTLRVNKFCTDFMYFDNTPVDGGMFLYQKVM